MLYSTYTCGLKVVIKRICYVNVNQKFLTWLEKQNHYEVDSELTVSARSRQTSVFVGVERVRDGVAVVLRTAARVVATMRRPRQTHVRTVTPRTHVRCYTNTHTDSVTVFWVNVCWHTASTRPQPQFNHRHRIDKYQTHV